MVGSPRLKISKYFGGASIQQSEINLDEANSVLGYFWTKDGSSNIVVSVDGYKMKSFEDLQNLASQDRYKNKAYINVGLFLSNEGKDSDSIWPSDHPTVNPNGR